MKKVTTTIIALVTIASSVIANNTNPSSSASVATASVNNSNVVLNFTAAANSNIEIERSFYSNNFTTVTTVNNVFAKNSNFIINDNATELSGREIAYYRVKQTSSNGTVSYSNTMVVNLNNNNSAVKSNNVINFTSAQNGKATITVKTVSGQVAATVNSFAVKGANTVEVSNLVSKGIFTVEVSVNGVVVDNQKIIAE
jgi:hypothetical protein